MKISFAQKILSYLYPVKVRKSAGEINPLLELFLYKGQWQLATEDAIYSDGDRYRPLQLAFGKIKQRLPLVKNALVLGTGLGSAVVILDKMGIRPKMDLVELDATILHWAKEFLPEKTISRLNFICENANKFMQQNTHQYDLIVVDVFMGREVPEFVTEKEFLIKCKQALTKEGVFVLNYIILQQENWEKIRLHMPELFPNHQIHTLGINRIVVATA